MWCQRDISIACYLLRCLCFIHQFHVLVFLHMKSIFPSWSLNRLYGEFIYIYAKVKNLEDKTMDGSNTVKTIVNIGMIRSSIVIRRTSRKLENSFATANFASARAQLSKLERQRVLPPNCGQIMKKTTVHLSQLPNSLPNLNFAQHFLFQ